MNEKLSNLLHITPITNLGSFNVEQSVFGT